MPDPFTLAALGVGTLGSLAGGVMNAATGPARKRKFLEDEKRKAQILALRNARWGALPKGPIDPLNFFPTNALDAKEKQDAVRSYADENFDLDPTSLLPFVQNATRFAGEAYDLANEPAPEVPRGELQLRKPSELQYFGNPASEPDVTQDSPLQPQGRRALTYRDPEQDTPWWMRD